MKILDPVDLLRLLRPKQWIKNGFVCAGVLFGARWHDLLALRAMSLAFLSFCLMGSSVYVLNDYLDREADRAHPTKRKRPLAAGTVTPIQGFAAGIGCLLGSIMAAWFADPRALLIVLVYLIINVAYSIGLKHLAVIDVFCIGSGFMLRILTGTWGIRISPTGWLILTGMFLTLFLGFAKRRAEWSETGGDSRRRRVLSQYSQTLLDSFLSITATGAVLSYGLYTLDPQTIALHHTDKLIYTLPFVLFGLCRYMLLLYSKNKGENPSVDVFTDPQILLCSAAYAGIVWWLLSR
jgi:4-hydroxybenzoate polyprenyltransferase